MTKLEIGKQRLQDVMGKSTEEIMESFEKISPDFANYVQEHVWGDIYARPGLADKTRLAAVVGTLLGQGNVGVPLRRYINAMLTTGWSKKEILELIIFLTIYAGYPITVDAIYIVEEVYKEFDKNGGHAK
jgi:4-carboxymuconolactone decarboxylase